MTIRARAANVPLRLQLMVVVIMLVIGALAITGVATTSTLRDYLVERVDQQLRSTSDMQQRRDEPPLPQAAVGSGAAPAPQPADRVNGPALLSGFYTEVVDANGEGEEQLRLPSGVSQSKPDLPTLTGNAITQLGTRPFTVPSEDGASEWRVLIVSDDDGSGAFVTAVNLSDIDQTVRRLATTVWMVSIGVLLALTIIGYVLVRSRLKKLVQVEQTAEQIAAGDLSQRVPNGDTRTEVGRVATAINTMMTRIEESFAAQKASEEEARTSEIRMRRFVGDASHELRTPLTSIRGFAELSRQGPEIVPNAMKRIEAEATRMSGLVEDLLMLARLDQHRPLESQPVDLYDLVEDAVQDAPATGPEHHVKLVVDDRARTTPMIVMGDEPRLRQVLANLMMNAYTHTPPGTDIEVRLRIDDDDAVMEVADNGPGLGEADAAKVFERFYRSDPSRQRASGGSGLGLSIVSGIVAAQGGSVTLDTELGRGATFAVRLPLVPTDDD